VKVAKELREAATEFCLTVINDNAVHTLQAVRVRVVDIPAVIAYANVLRSVSTNIKMPSQSLVWRWCMTHASVAPTKGRSKHTGDGSIEELSLSQLRDLCEDLVPDAGLHFVTERTKSKSNSGGSAGAGGTNDVELSAGAQLEPRPTPHPPQGPGNLDDVGTKLQVALAMQDDATAILRVGTKVEARFGGEDEWYKGEIKEANLDCTYAIEYEDGDKEEKVARSLIRARVGVGAVLNEATAEVTTDKLLKQDANEESGSEYADDYDQDSGADGGDYSDGGFE